MLDVMVQLAPEAARAVRDAPLELGEIDERLRPLELTLEPLHPGSQDRSLGSWFRVQVEDESTAELLVRTLSDSPVVESAYVEPLSAPPA